MRPLPIVGKRSGVTQEDGRAPRDTNGNRFLEPAHEKQNENDNQNDADDPDAAVTVPVSITAEASTESAKQEDDENDDEDQSERHEGCPPSGMRQLRHAP